MVCSVCLTCLVCLGTLWDIQQLMFGCCVLQHTGQYFGDETSETYSVEHFRRDVVGVRQKWDDGVPSETTQWLKAVGMSRYLCLVYFWILSPIVSASLQHLRFLLVRACVLARSCIYSYVPACMRLFARTCACWTGDIYFLHTRRVREEGSLFACGFWAFRSYRLPTTVSFLCVGSLF